MISPSLNIKIREKILPQDSLPSVRGKLVPRALLSSLTWFRVGGEATFLFKPADCEDLIYFLAEKPPELAIQTLGGGSNLLIRDGGIEGCVIKLGSAFAQIRFEGDVVIVGAGALDRTLVMTCLEHSLTGLEFLVGIPGTLGGAVAMNAGAYGYEVKDFLIWVDCLTPQGEKVRLTPNQLSMTYRNGNIPKDYIILEAAFQCQFGYSPEIKRRIDEYLFLREASQPIRGRTGGSTFKNPTHKKAWELIDEAGCRGLQIGEAQISPKHCNFMLNLGTARAEDIENLGEMVREKVLDHSGVNLEWEIIRWGRKN
jgi:UDP-N-acetylmuramate dehydrogenase